MHGWLLFKTSIATSSISTTQASSSLQAKSLSLGCSWNLKVIVTCLFNIFLWKLTWLFFPPECLIKLLPLCTIFLAVLRLTIKDSNSMGKPLCREFYTQIKKPTYFGDESWNRNGFTAKSTNGRTVRLIAHAQSHICPIPLFSCIHYNSLLYVV